MSLVYLKDVWFALFSWIFFSFDLAKVYRISFYSLLILIYIIALFLELSMKGTFYSHQRYGNVDNKKLPKKANKPDQSKMPRRKFAPMTTKEARET